VKLSQGRPLEDGSGAHSGSGAGKALPPRKRKLRVKVASEERYRRKPDDPESRKLALTGPDAPLKRIQRLLEHREAGP
jgi:hypothetical protein